MSNWTNIQDLGIVCPVCGKSDLCAVIMGKPMVPSMAACCRIKEGCYGELKGGAGYLHILGKGGNYLEPETGHVLES